MLGRVLPGGYPAAYIVSFTWNRFGTSETIPVGLDIQYAMELLSERRYIHGALTGL